MIPGVVPSPTLPTLSKGQLVAITQYKSGTPLIVGSMAVDGTSLKEDEDQKGKAVVTLHAMGDALWALGSKREPPNIAVESDAPTGATEELTKGVERLDIEDSGTQKAKEEDPSDAQEPGSRLPTPQGACFTPHLTQLHPI